MDMEGGREGGTSGESSMKTYFAYLKQIASGNLLNEQGVSANLVLSDNRGVEWGGRWEGDSRGKGHMYTYG